MKKSLIILLMLSVIMMLLINACEWLNPSESKEEAKNRAPNMPSDPDPADGATGIGFEVTLSWTGGDPDAGDQVTYDVYFGVPDENGQIPLVSENQTPTSYTPTKLEYDTEYSWGVDVTDNHGLKTEGPIWTFTTLRQVMVGYSDDSAEGSRYISYSTPVYVNDNEYGFCMRLTPPSYPFTLANTYFYFVEFSYPIYLHVFDDNGTNGTPQTDLLPTPFMIDYAPVQEWFYVDVSYDNVIINSGSIYVGFCYSYLDQEGAATVSIGEDLSTTFANRTWVNLGYGWANLADLTGIQTNLMIVAEGTVPTLGKVIMSSHLSPQVINEIDSEKCKIIEPVRNRSNSK